MSSKKTGPMRIGPFRLDMPLPSPTESREVAWLRDMVESRRQRGIPEEGSIMVGEERSYMAMLRGSVVK